MDNYSKATSLARIHPQPVTAPLTLGLYGFVTTALMVIVHLAS